MKVEQDKPSSSTEDFKCSVITLAEIGTNSEDSFEATNDNLIVSLKEFDVKFKISHAAVVALLAILKVSFFILS